MTTNKNSGIADQGSRLYLQEYMVKAKDELSELMIAASPSLLSFVDSKTKIEWKSPLEESEEVIFYEYRDDFLKVLGLDQGAYENAKSELKKFWPKNGPQWDGLAIVVGDHGPKGLLLVEAKAHTAEMKADLKASSPESILLIQKSMAIAQGHYGIKPTDWTNKYYQLGNRIAYLYFMNEILHIPTWLGLVNFVGGKHKPTSRGEWLAHYHKSYTAMGINHDDYKLLNYVIQVFPKCC